MAQSESGFEKAVPAMRECMALSRYLESIHTATLNHKRGNPDFLKSATEQPCLLACAFCRKPRALLPLPLPLSLPISLFSLSCRGSRRTDALSHALLALPIKESSTPGAFCIRRMQGACKVFG